MNTHELIESTMLHAMGLLDDAEREAYEAAFAVAPESVQNRVREEARRMADLGDLMPETEPSSELRMLVLAAVRAAMREEENEARIAQDQSLPERVIGRISADTTPPLSTRRATSQPKLSSSNRVSRAWRGAAIGLAAASIALGVVTVSTLNSYKEVQPNALVANLYDKIGAQFLESTMFDANTRRVALTAVAASDSDSDASNNNGEMQTGAVASVWTNPDWDTARLLVQNFKADSAEPYHLVVLDDEGNIVREIATFTPTGEFQDFNVDVNLSTERNLAIFHSMAQDIKDASPILLSSEGSL